MRGKKNQIRHRSRSLHYSVHRSWSAGCTRQVGNPVVGTICFIIIVSLGFVAVAQAAQGDLDLAFGIGGKSTADFGGTTDYVFATVMQPDGKIIVAGRAIFNYNDPAFFSEFALARYNPNGSLDPSFGNEGKVLTLLGGGQFDTVSELALQPDGKIVAVGQARSPGTFNVDITVVRYNSDGSYDTTFGSGGIVQTHLAGTDDQGSGVVLQPDGKIVVAGRTGNSFYANFVILRYNSNGSPDSTFGSTGSVTTHFDGGYQTTANARDVALLPDGKLVAAGFYFKDSGYPTVHAFVRYNPNGSLDTTFGDGGKVVSSVAGFPDHLLPKPDGRFLVVGHIGVGYHDNDFELAQYNADGSLDTGFGSNGKVTTSFTAGSDDLAHAVALQPDGKIVVAGETGNYPHFHFALARYSSDGQLDPTFGTNGKVSTALSSSWDAAYSLALQPDGKIVLAGECDQCPGGLDFALVRYIGVAAPTAGPAAISGRITAADGTPLGGVVMVLSGAQSRKTISDANGNYQFDNVDTGGFYTVTPARTNYSFSPANRSFSQLGNHTDAAFTGSVVSDSANPLDSSEYFVREQYVDVLGREPDEGGFNYWSDQINRCGADAECIRVQRISVAAAFFMAQEFQESGSFIYNMYAGTLGRRPLFAEYALDRQQVVGGADLDSEKTAFAQSFVQRAEFATKYQANATAESFVEALIQSVQSSGFDLSTERANLVDAYSSGGTIVESRVLVLRAIADNAAFKQSQYNAAFVLTEYFGYLRRDPDQGGYDFWLNVLNNREPENFRGMVCAFITSTEYQRRFSSSVSHSNGECGR
jgi:uncharacterized delta-60 repeat protein